MIFINPTRYPAMLFRTVLDDDRIFASILVRVTYTLGPTLKIADDQLWKVSPEPWDSPGGKMEEDGPFMRGGVDLFVFGEVRAPDNETRSMTVRVKAGGFVRDAVATGRRTWIRKFGKGLVKGRPAPFTSLPLTLASAFGGASEADGLQLPYPDNAEGKGYHVTEEQAEGQELPNLEETDGCMQRWNDVPPVCGFGFCPHANSARLLNGTVIDDDYHIRDFRSQLFNQAFVPMIAPTLAPGDPVELTGFTSDGPMRFSLPEPPAGVGLMFGDRVVERQLAVDQVGVEVDERRVFVTWRYPFKYVVREREKRMCQLIEGETA